MVHADDWAEIAGVAASPVDVATTGTGLNAFILTSGSASTLANDLAIVVTQCHSAAASTPTASGWTSMS